MPSLPHVSSLHQHQRAMQSFFMAENLRQELLRRNEAQLQFADAAGIHDRSLFMFLALESLKIPQEVHNYHSLYPLEPPQQKPSKTLGFLSSTYRATSSKDGKQYILRRVEGYQLNNESAINAVEAWRRLRHCNIVSVREAFTTKAFGDFSLVIVYDYHPASITVADKIFTGTARPCPEKHLWSYITQLASAIKSVHSAGLSIRILDATKILVTGKNR
jgi:PAB-dependent poly(A)-specific ribonuclease subunit 3